MPIQIGLKGRAQCAVDESNTALAAGSGTLPVFATPFLAALMEKAAWTSIAPFLAPGESTVGTWLEISHDAATPLGLTVWAESEVIAVEGRRIRLKVWAYDQAGPIGQGTHQRVIITDQRFLAKTEQKRSG